ncbi:MAG: hypothetical protein CMO34_05240 [Verrucomicrobia bacterium]|nr:hypothetical protein [Verrucomicrobiota bacterium]
MVCCFTHGLAQNNTDSLQKNIDEKIDKYTKFGYEYRAFMENSTLWVANKNLCSGSFFTNDLTDKEAIKKNLKPWYDINTIHYSHSDTLGQDTTLIKNYLKAGLKKGYLIVTRPQRESFLINNYSVVNQ